MTREEAIKAIAEAPTPQLRVIGKRILFAYIYGGGSNDTVRNQ